MSQPKMKLREAMLNAIFALEELRAAIERAGPSEERHGVQAECLCTEAAIAHRLAFKLEQQAQRRSAAAVPFEFNVGDQVRQVSADDATFPEGMILTVIDPMNQFSMRVRTPQGDEHLVRVAAFEPVTR